MPIIYFNCINAPETIFRGTQEDFNAWNDDGYGPELCKPNVISLAENTQHGKAVRTIQTKSGPFTQYLHDLTRKTKGYNQ